MINVIFKFPYPLCARNDEINIRLRLGANPTTGKIEILRSSLAAFLDQRLQSSRILHHIMPLLDTPAPLGALGGKGV